MAKELDQYYTSPSVAQSCYDTVLTRFPGNYLQVEPSAGTGAFFSLMPNGSLAYDLDPKYTGVSQRDFLTVDISSALPVMMIGNPPFGKNASLAIRFFNHAAKMSSVIAFIVPRTFRKASLINKLDSNFHIVHDELLGENAFIHEGRPYDVPCTFQIWERRAEQRTKIVSPTTHPDFLFTTSEHADFAVQRVGVRAGTIKSDIAVSEQSHYFIKAPVVVRERMETINFERVKHDTAGNPSISKGELILLYEDVKRQEVGIDPDLFRMNSRHLGSY